MNAVSAGNTKSPNLTVEAAFAELRKRFPFEGYIDSAEDGIRNIASTVATVLSPGATVLDFGSGPCDKTGILQLMGYRCSAIDDLGDDWHHLGDNEERILSFIRWCGIDFHHASPGSLTKMNGRDFDLLMLNDVLEHLHESPRELMNQLLSSVRPGGLVLITVPNAGNIRKRLALLWGRTNLPAYELYYWQPGRWRGHIREYVRSDLEQLASYLGLTPLQLRGCDHMMSKVPGRLRGLYGLITGVFDGFKDTWMMLGRKPADWQPRTELPREELEQILRKYSAYNYK
ncbi:MAG TPA: methyltransferase domain-containing protein [Candidatus Ozemobacteraceae bacterium]|nr:methyltransferase domain-containing protein [Candidatus Ozemobacteraceae bacterium]